MQLKEFSDKVEAVRRFRAGEPCGTPRVLKALGEGYRVTIPFASETDTFAIKVTEVERMLAEFPGVDGLWQLFVKKAEDSREVGQVPAVG